MPNRIKLIAASGKEVWVPLKTVEFLQDLDEEKLEQLIFAMNFANNVRLLSRVLRFLVMGGLAIAAMVFTIWSNAKNSIYPH